MCVLAGPREAACMGWMSVLILNAVIAVSYVAIAGLILQGLLRTGQVRTNPLALATATIFLTCAVHHAHHGLHMVVGSGSEQTAAIRAVFGEWHSVAVDAVGAVVAVVYLGLRRSYKTLLHTPAMFDDAVRVAAEQHWRERALTDPLTGIPNRAAYQQLADQLATDATTVDVAVLFLDLDGFKAINDRYGHDAGDRLLCVVAERLVEMLAPGETVFRLGGDEFAIVCSERADRFGVADVLQRVQRELGRPCDVRGGEVVIDASVGIAVGPAKDGVDPLLRQADSAMYRVKADRASALPSPRRAEEHLMFPA